ncbi:hypothetical protein SLA2020_403440 [Shorea laevis]
MQQAIPYKSWQPLKTNTHFTQLSLTLNSTTNNPLNATSSSSSPPHKQFLKETDHQNILALVSENAVIVFGRRGCCMSHVVNRLLLGLGVNPAVYEVDEEDDERVAENWI